ncbi:MAG: replicative DNA helicase [Candidatus Improbicoccus devescovinae]|nr:MAG: replicative DNA helicase [Candidatus Improbicoccus devescovinae]
MMLNKIKEFSFLYNLEAEQSVLGAVMIDSQYLAIVIEIIPDPDYFYSNEHKKIYSCMMSMFALNQKIDYITVFEYLKSSGEFEFEYIKNYLLDLSQIVPSISSASIYAKIVRDKYDIRRLVNTVNEVMEHALEGENTENLLEFTEQRLYEIRSGQVSSGFKHIKETLFKVSADLDKLVSSDEKNIPGIPTGFSDLDKIISGLNSGDLILVAARPGMGKTSFALNIAVLAARHSKSKVAVFSLEMNAEQLVYRLVSSAGLIPGNKLRSGNITSQEWTSFTNACAMLGDLDILIDDSAGITVSEMRSKIMRLKNLNILIIDYLQLISAPRESQNRVSEITTITRQLKILAKDFNIPIICLSQLSRASEHRANHRPVLSDLRDSGSIEQDADIVMFLYRESYYSSELSENIDHNKCECIIAKNRHGETATVNMHWQGEFTRFTEYTNYN